MAEFSKIRFSNDGTVLGEDDLVLEDFYKDPNQLALLRDLATDESKFNAYLHAREETDEETGGDENSQSDDQVINTEDVPQNKTNLAEYSIGLLRKEEKQNA